MREISKGYVGMVEDCPSWVIEADSIEELAQQIGVPPENLKDTMKKVNGYAEKGHDPEFGRKPEHLEAGLAAIRDAFASPAA